MNHANNQKTPANAGGLEILSPKEIDTVHGGEAAQGSGIASQSPNNRARVNATAG